MTPERIKVLASDIYNFTFQIVDAEPDTNGDFAGRIAIAVQRAFEYAALSDDCEKLAARIISDAQHDGTIQYDLEVKMDHIEVRGNAICSGNDDLDNYVEDNIIKRLEGGDVWAWAAVTVTCRIPGYCAVGRDHLGACSYASEDDFKQIGSYKDMKREACLDLETELAAELAR